MKFVNCVCKSCKRSFLHGQSSAGGRRPYYCPDCQSTVALKQTRERVRRHRQAQVLREEAVPVQGPLYSDLDGSPNYTANQVHQYLHSEEFAQRIEELLAPLDEETAQHWRDRFNETILTRTTPHD